MEKDEEDLVLDTRYLEIKKLKEKLKSLVGSDLSAEEFIYNGKNIHENDVNSVMSESQTLDESIGDENNDEFIDCLELDFADERTWLFGANDVARKEPETFEDICRLVYIDVNDNDNTPDVSDIISELRIARKLSSSSSNASSISSQKIPIDSRTFTRPKKFTSRPSLNSVMDTTEEEGRTKLQRRLTTTILPSPNLIPKLEELSKVNNRPVSGNYSDVNWEDGAEEGLANMDNSINRSKRRSIPASLFERLQELKRSNNAYALSKALEPNLNGNVLNGKLENLDRGDLLEDAKKVTAAFKFNASSASRLSEIFGSTPEYFSDDNDSFINLDAVSCFCDRLTLSTDQSTYTSIVKEMEKSEICLFHRTSFEEPEENRLTFGGVEIPHGKDSNRMSGDGSLNRTYGLDNKSEEKLNRTFEIKNESLSKKNSLNSTFEVDKKPGLVDVIMQSDILKNFTPNLEINCNNKNMNACEGNNILNNTYDKLSETFSRNEINTMHNEKYTTKIFDATFKKSSPAKSEKESPPDNKNNGKKDSDHSEDDCMSTTSDNSYRSVESNNELKNIEELKNIALEQHKKLNEKKFSTPKCEGTRVVMTRKSEEWPSFSPIRKDSGDVESQTSSNASSRGPSPRMYSTTSAEGLIKARPVAVRQSINKVPQRELKLKPALMRPSQNYRRTINNLKTTSEPSVPQKVESCPNATTCVPAFRPAVQPIVPSSARPSSRTSGIPRPPSKLKPPQIRTTEDRRK